MKLKTKRTLLIVKKYLYVVWCGMALFFIGYGLSLAVNWGIGKHEEIRLKKTGIFLTETLNPRNAKNGRVEIYNKKLRKVVGCNDQVFAQDYGSSLTEIIQNSSEGSVIVCNDSLYGYIDPVSGNVLVEPQYIMTWESDSIGTPHFGVFDKKGNMTVPAIYDQMAFVDTYDKVLILCQKDGILRGIDHNGSLMSDFCFYDDCAYADNVYVLRDSEENVSHYIQYKALNGYGVMDANFRVVVMPNDYCDIQYLGNDLFACGSSENYSVIIKDDAHK